MGYTSWFRAFTVANFFSFFPLALSYTIVASGHAGSAGAYMWLSEYWAGYVGWATSFANLALAATLIAGRFDDEYAESIWKAP